MARHTAAEAVTALLQENVKSGLEDYERAETDNDHISEPSGHSDTEILEPLCNKNKAP